MRSNTKGLTEAVRVTLIDGPKGMATIIKELNHTWADTWIKNRIKQLSSVNKSGKQYLQIMDDDGEIRYRLTETGMKQAQRDIELMQTRKQARAEGGQLFELIYTDEDSGQMVLRAEDGTLVQAKALVLS